MCTAIGIFKKSHIFGRTLDVEAPYGEAVIVTPRRFSFDFRYVNGGTQGYAILGIGIERGGFPLYFDAVNERGLAAAGLNFSQSAYYRNVEDGKLNLASFELIPYILSHCTDVVEAKDLLREVNVTSDGFSEDLSPAPLHWIFADRNGSIVLESTVCGTAVYDDPVGVLTNEPPFPFHMARLADHAYLSARQPKCDWCEVTPYSRGMGAVGLPGDFSSASRFARAAFISANVREICGGVTDFFKAAAAVSVPYGCVETDDGQFTYTRYVSCADLDRIEYYYSAYCDTVIHSFGFGDADINGNTIELLHYIK